MSSSDEDDDGEKETFFDAQTSGNVGEAKPTLVTCRDTRLEPQQRKMPSDDLHQLDEPATASRSDVHVDIVPPRQRASQQPDSRPRTSDGSSSRSAQYRLSLQDAPALPAIPARFLENATPASLLAPALSRASTRSGTDGSPRKNQRSRVTEIVPVSASQNTRPRSSGGETSSDTKRALVSHSSRNGVSRGGTPVPASVDVSSPRSARRKSLPAFSHPETLAQLEHARKASTSGEMARQGRGDGDDLFLELARDQSGAGRSASRLSRSGKHRSLPAAEQSASSPADRRPKSSGSILNRPQSRLGALQSDLQRHVDRYRSPSTAADDMVSVTGRSVSGRAYRYANLPERSPRSPSSRLGDRVRSPELPSYGRRRPSFGVTPASLPKVRQGQFAAKAQNSQDESPADSSEPKRSLPDSESADSQTADTVWDELDDLKSRIKKLELTGKIPATSGAAVSGDSSERPRTATTAPTTIDSSPKNERKPDAESQPQPVENNVGGPNAANIHPLLHSALAKAKPLLNATLYRTLEATASDALQLASLTGSAGPQGTAFSAASIINGVTVADRHVRRKADTMCRNLTDLCLALCEGKHETPSVAASPIVLDSAKASPSLRYPRSSLSPGDGGRRVDSRPMSRLEARRTSILGLQASANSPRDSTDDISASEKEATPSPSQDQQRPPRRISRASSRLLSVRTSRMDDGASGDEDPTIRPLSRAMTDVGSFRSKPSGPRTVSQQRSPSLRDALAARQANGAAYESNREPLRVASLSSDTSRRRYLDPATPSVQEEDDAEPTEYQPSVVPQRGRRVASLGQFSSRRAGADVPYRSSSLKQRRDMIVE